MSGNPVARDVDSTANPHLLVLLYVIEESLQGTEASGPSHQPAVQADGHHFGRALTFGVEHVETVAQVVKELITAVCPSARAPDLAQMQAFVTNGKQGINYHPGTWHHVLLTPYAAMRFICVDRAGEGNNCIDHHIAATDQRLLELP